MRVNFPDYSGGTMPDLHRLPCYALAGTQDISSERLAYRRRPSSLVMLEFSHDLAAHRHESYSALSSIVLRRGQAVDRRVHFPLNRRSVRVNGAMSIRQNARVGASKTYRSAPRITAGWVTATR
jgi:hypothetical protein